jgi:hypothetical protein
VARRDGAGLAHRSRDAEAGKNVDGGEAGRHPSKRNSPSAQDPLARFIRASHGIFDIIVIRRETEMMAVVVAALHGDRNAIRILEAVGKILRRADHGKVDCLNHPACGTRFSANQPPAAIAIAMPFATDAGAYVASGLCSRCASADDLAGIILRSWREILPDARVVDGGRA